MNTASVMASLIRKDLMLAGRMRSGFGVACVTGLLIVAVLAVGFGPGASASAGTPGASGSGSVLWLAFLVAGVLCLDRTAQPEHADRAVDALRLSPVPPWMIVGSKFVANLLVLLVVAGGISVASVILLNITFASVWMFAATVVLGLVGLTSIGTLMSLGLGGADSAGAPGRSDLLALVMLPLMLPLVIITTRVMERCVTGGAEGTDSGTNTGIGMLVAADAVYLAAGWLVCGSALEE